MQPHADLIVASSDQFDKILADSNNMLELKVIESLPLTIDDIVIVIAARRGILDDRKAWWQLRRDVYGRFAEHHAIPSRTLAMIPHAFQGELAEIDAGEVELIASQWLNADHSTPSDLESAVRTLQCLIEACSSAHDSGLAVMLRTNQPANEFELAFEQLENQKRRRFRKAFDGWDEAKRHEAHQRYKYYLSQGEADSLTLTLQDFTRSKILRINLKTDRGKVQRYLRQRIKAYIKRPQPDAGEADSPITAISVLFDIEYEGFVDLVFDTRPESAESVEFIEGTDHVLDLEHWHDAVMRIDEGESLKLALPDGTKLVIEPESSEVADWDRYVGDMLRDLVIEMRGKGEFEKLNLAAEHSIWVGGTHTDFFWKS
ncbi:hypothetical protein [Rhodopirellula sp. MGV]|uniref:hypothetical protein n=1 Tax=Rhodopirellula sp. MGV TaxID=2023130 RepID=UPI000B974C81|nr:hypothetical protein [Rhodopirellula sp. MGV]OYP37951.1 hypothetical protein CGZ80_03765 [Rhodopirellula sp. MGV]PNY34253.1 hypothetical protein C2E31_23730 [Rhodopirellula baltica]